MIGRQLGHFRITGSIGAGGMGVVYKAVDVRLQRAVALKLLPPELSADPERRSRFEREARAASALNHPNIVTVHEIDTADGVDFIVMEHVEGSTLDVLIGPRGLGVAEALSYASQIAEALAAAHAAGIIHRDLKPRNVIVTPQRLAKVLDFGLAKRVPGELGELGESAAPTMTAEPLTAEGAIAGTAPYMSPEQAEGRKLDARSDIFSFGVVLYEMLTGRRPFQGESPAQVLGAILRDEPPPARSLRQDLPEDLNSILSKALEKDPEYRYQHMSDVLADLRRLKRAESSGPARAVARTKRAGRQAGLAAIAAALVMGALVWGLRARPPAPAALQFRPLSTFSGSHRAPSFSPDGRMVAFIDAARDVPQVWVKYLGEGEPVQVTSGEFAAGRPRWSPKGEQILYERVGQGIWTIPPLGGPSRRILEDGSCPAFFPDGERIVFDRGEELWTVRLDGSEARPIPGVPSNFFSTMVKRCAAVSPDGRWVAYYQPERGPLGDFWVIPASGGTPRRLTSDSAEGGGLTWSPDGRSLIVSSARRGGRTLWRVPVEGGEPEPITTGAGDDVDPELSRDGLRIVYANARHSDALMLLDPATGQQREVLERRAHLNGPAFSPDGSRIAFFMTTDELEHLFTIRTDGNDLRQVTKGGRQGNVMPHWSGDGSALYYYQQLDRPSFRRVPVAGGPSNVIADGWRWEVQNSARVDPQDRMLAYSRFEQGRLKATLLRELATGRETLLPHIVYPAEWSPGGSSLAGGDGQGRIVVCSTDGSSCRVLGAGRFAAWSADGSRLYVERNVRVLDDPMLCSVEVWLLRSDGSDARRLTTLGPERRLTSEIAVSATDQIAWVQFRRGKEELWLAELGPR